MYGLCSTICSTHFEKSCTVQLSGSTELREAHETRGGLSLRNVRVLPLLVRALIRVLQRIAPIRTGHARVLALAPLEVVREELLPRAAVFLCPLTTIHISALLLPFPRVPP